MKRIAQSKTARIILACAAGALYTLALPHMLPIDDTLWFSDSIWPLFVFMGLSAFFFKMWGQPYSKQDDCGRLPAILFACFLSFCLIFGKYAVVQTCIPYGDLKLYALIALATYPLYLIIAYSWRLTDGIAASIKTAKSSVSDRLFSSRYLCVIIAASLLLLWLPTWLANWPGTFLGDHSIQLAQYESGAVTTDFPVLHNLFIGFILSSVKGITGSYNAGIAVFTGIQMVILSLIFAYAIKVLRDMGAPRLMLILSWLWFALHPVVRLFSKDTVRDTLFSAALLLFALALTQAMPKKDCAANKKKAVLLTASGFLCGALRNAGFYLVIVVCAAALLLLFFMKKPTFPAKAKSFTIYALAAIIALSFLWKGPICGSFVSDGNLKSENCPSRYSRLPALLLLNGMICPTTTRNGSNKSFPAKFNTPITITTSLTIIKRT